MSKKGGIRAEAGRRLVCSERYDVYLGKGSVTKEAWDV